MMLSLVPQPWSLQGKCAKHTPTDVDFFPGKKNIKEGRNAKDYCNGDGEYAGDMCPVRDECRAYAVDSVQPFGIWGGMNRQERRAITEQKERRTLPSGVLQQLRLRTGFSQGAAASVVGVTRPALSAWESGGRQYRVEYYDWLCNEVMK